MSQSDDEPKDKTQSVACFETENTCSHCARLRLKASQDSGECVRALERQGLIPKDRATMYVKMMRFRNVLVRLYGEVDNRPPTWQLAQLVLK